MLVFETPRVLLVGSWGSEAAVSAFTDALYRGVPWDEALRQSPDVVERRISAFYRQGHWSVFEFMGAQFLVECSRACHTQFIRHMVSLGILHRTWKYNRSTFFSSFSFTTFLLYLWNKCSIHSCYIFRCGISWGRSSSYLFIHGILN